MDEESRERYRDMKGMGWKVSLSILAGVGWLVFLVVWLFFYAQTYVWEKNLAIVLASLLVLIAIVGLPWGIWAIRHRTTEEDEMWKTKGFRWRVWVSGIAMLAVFLFLIYWFWYLAEPYDVYQNLAIFIVSLLIAGGLLAAMWAPWGMKYGTKPFHAREHETEEK
jgi:O-antigen/teichoic acid export membrane protein